MVACGPPPAALDGDAARRASCWPGRSLDVARVVPAPDHDASAASPSGRCGSTGSTSPARSPWSRDRGRRPRPARAGVAGGGRAAHRPRRPAPLRRHAAGPAHRARAAPPAGPGPAPQPARGSSSGRPGASRSGGATGTACCASPAAASSASCCSPSPPASACAPPTTASRRSSSSSGLALLPRRPRGRRAAGPGDRPVRPDRSRAPRPAATSCVRHLPAAWPCSWRVLGDASPASPFWAVEPIDVRRSSWRPSSPARRAVRRRRRHRQRA